jgi:hypothetical protein
MSLARDITPQSYNADTLFIKRFRKIMSGADQAGAMRCCVQ